MDATQNEKALSILKAQCQKWGGDLKVVDPAHLEKLRNTSQSGFATAPFTSNLGILWDVFTVLCLPETKWAFVIHEMGHVFACREFSDDVNEWDFWGWEITLVHHLGLDFEAWCLDIGNTYNVPVPEKNIGFMPQYTRFGRLNKSAQRKVMKTAIDHATKLGLIRDKTPLAVRQPRKTRARAA